MVASFVNQLNQDIQRRFKAWVNQADASMQTQSLASGLAKTTMNTVLTKFVGQAIPFSTRNGFKVIDVRRGYVKAFMPFKPNKNHFNAMYAGALFTVAELPGGIITLLSFDERFFPILVDLKMEFVKMAKTDVTVEFYLSDEELKRIESDTLSEGKGEFVLEGEIKDSSGELVAKSFANYQVRLKK